MSFLQRMLELVLRRPSGPDPTVTMSEEHRHTLERADALLDDPRLARVLAERQRVLRDAVRLERIDAALDSQVRRSRRGRPA